MMDDYFWVGFEKEALSMGAGLSHAANMASGVKKSLAGARDTLKGLVFGAHPSPAAAVKAPVTRKANMLRSKPNSQAKPEIGIKRKATGARDASVVSRNDAGKTVRKGTGAPAPLSPAPANPVKTTRTVKQKAAPLQPSAAVAVSELPAPVLKQGPVAAATPAAVLKQNSTPIPNEPGILSRMAKTPKRTAALGVAALAGGAYAMNNSNQQIQ